MAYPTSVPAFTTKQDNASQIVAAAHINDLQTEVAAVETAMLTNGLAHNLIPDSTAGGRTLGSAAKHWGQSYLKAITLLDATELTIATGAVIVTQGYHKIDTEANAATDDLETLTATGLTAGFIVVLRAEDITRVVTVKDGTGNLLLNGDYALSATDRTITLIYDGTNWRELARSVITTTGRIVQAVQGTHSTQATNDTSTYADTGLTATITPTKSTNKIRVTVTVGGCAKDTGNTELQLRLRRDSTTIAQMGSNIGNTASAATIWVGSQCITYLDSPASTSALVYKVQFASSANVARAYVQGNSALSVILLEEIEQ